MTMLPLCLPRKGKFCFAFRILPRGDHVGSHRAVGGEAACYLRLRWRGKHLRCRTACGCNAHHNSYHTHELFHIPIPFTVGFRPLPSRDTYRCSLPAVFGTESAHFFGTYLLERKRKLCDNVRGQHSAHGKLFGSHIGGNAENMHCGAHALIQPFPTVHGAYA